MPLYKILSSVWQGISVPIFQKCPQLCLLTHYRWKKIEVQYVTPAISVACECCSSQVAEICRQFSTNKLYEPDPLKIQQFLT